MLSAFGVFAVGYLARPVGATVFGHIGDRYGRKNAMMASLSLMGLATFFLAILPTYAQIGPSAAVLLVFCRILQGLSVGGEFTGSIVFLAEHALSERRGTITAIAQTSSMGGFLIGSAVCTLASWQLGKDAMSSWG